MADGSPTKGGRKNSNGNAGDSSAAGAGNENKATVTSPTQETQPNRKPLYQGQQVGIQPSTNQSDPLAEFDEYGTELPRDARIWKVYVEETDKCDKELVEGWKGFLIESSKKLREDPADVPAQSLLLIAQTLRELTNRTEGKTPASSNNTGFTPTRSAVAINTLWYLSLSLSLASAFISILAKDWCNSFLAGRTGHPYEQSQRRQRKWNMIERLRMPELITILPSLIHGALLLFAIGLCIYLWDLNVTVAIPVICVSIAATCFYVWSGIMAIIIDDFPYSTIISRVYRSEPVQDSVRAIRQAFQSFQSFISNRVQSISQSPRSELRGLSSFTQWRPQPIEPSATEVHAGEAKVINVPDSDTVDPTSVAATEHAIDGDHVADVEATETANEVREREGEGQVDANAGHETMGEGGETAVGGQANTEAGNGETSRPESEDHGAIDGRQQMGGLMVVRGQETMEERTGTGSEGQETKQEQNGTGEAELGSGSQGHVSIDMSNRA